MPKITLNRTNPKITIHINEENPLLKIKSFRFEPDDTIKYKDHYNKIKLKYVKKVRPQFIEEQSEILGSVPNLFSRIDQHQRKTTTSIDFILNDANEEFYGQIELLFENEGDEDIFLELKYEIQTIHPFTVASNGFKEHFEQKGNSKILFSSPFGTGKTTFLREFFLENQEYEVFHLFPVNYSVATNEDIFKYIKVELLFSLLERNVEFDMESFNRSMTLPFYIGQQAHEILLPFARLLPKVGKSIHVIINDLVRLVKGFESHHASAQIDDKDTAVKFIKEVYEKEGSIFEDNFYTQLIRQMIEQIQTKRKKTVLILDDLDRIDPEHIFRILNVFAAHVDRQGFPDEMANKFGLDRVIIVCHYDNLKKILQHKYGRDTDFSGYMDKYFSRSIFEFDFVEIADIMMNVLINESKTNDIRMFNRSVGALITCKKLTLRELVLISNIDLKLLLNPSLYPNFFIVHYLSQVMGIDRVISVFDECHTTMVNPVKRKDRTNYNMFFNHALADYLLLGTEFSELKDLEYNYKEYSIKMIVQKNFTHKDLIKVTVAKNKVEIKEPHPFGISDFFYILKELAKRYKEVGGLKGLE